MQNPGNTSFLRFPKEMEKMLYVKGSMECARIPAGVVVEEDVEMTDTCSTVYVCMLMCTCTHICVHKHCRGTFRF